MQSNPKRIAIDGLNISYKIFGNGGINVLLLHGWGTTKEIFEPVINIISKESDLKLITLDFPGFGESDMPKKALDTIDYEKIIYNFIKAIGLNKIILIGHSFGGRISIRLASSHPENVNKVILVDSAGLKPKRKLSYYIKVYSFKFSKFFLKILFKKKKLDKKMKTLYSKYGSEDYKHTNAMLRETLVKVVNEDLSTLLPKIKAPILLMWGENDNDTPVWMAKQMDSLIQDSGLVVLKGAGHYSFIDKLNEFCIIIKKFILN